MIFYCTNCKKEIKVSDKKAEGYLNWKCPDCQHIAIIKDTIGISVQWKCDTGTVRRREFRKKHKR